MPLWSISIFVRSSLTLGRIFGNMTTVVISVFKYETQSDGCQIWNFRSESPSYRSERSYFPLFTPNFKDHSGWAVGICILKLSHCGRLVEAIKPSLYNQCLQGHTRAYTYPYGLFRAGRRPETTEPSRKGAFLPLFAPFSPLCAAFWLPFGCQVGLRRQTCCQPGL
mgnify:CR=1 FL=1